MLVKGDQSANIKRQSANIKRHKAKKCLKNY